MRLLLWFAFLPVFWWGTAYFLKTRGVKTWARHLAGLLAGLLAMCGFAVVVVLYAMPPTSHKATAPTSAVLSTEAAAPKQAKAPSPAEAPDYLLAAADTILEDYSANEVAADLKYKGKNVVVYGNVHNVERAGAGDIVVRVELHSPLQTVWAFLKTGSEATAARLIKGKWVTLNCTGAGAVAGTPIFRECSLHK